MEEESPRKRSPKRYFGTSKNFKMISEKKQHEKNLRNAVSTLKKKKSRWEKKRCEQNPQNSFRRGHHSSTRGKSYGHNLSAKSRLRAKLTLRSTIQRTGPEYQYWNGISGRESTV
ncbi:hypothetical protein OCU04_004882 [Sclerotinia nivalis]|uniref:Uncharacterized protein n=1 Tax=Sclerotinia nivalis TaxID=352851 RepID=A0A9X0ARE0_9HELO|nr:hypothetical protein OCU04_004882 [Sclerotinia nivalis]